MSGENKTNRDLIKGTPSKKKKKEESLRRSVAMNKKDFQAMCTKKLWMRGCHCQEMCSFNIYSLCLKLTFV